MTLSQWLVIAAIAIPIVLIMLDKLASDLAGLIIIASLGLAQFAGASIFGPTSSDAVKSLTGFSQPATITLIALFILSHALDKSGIPRWIARNLLRIGGNSEWKLIGLLTSTTALLSLVMNNLAAGALVLPMAMEISRRTRIRPSRLLIPVAYGSILGGTATYFTTANIIVSDMLLTARPPQHPLHILDFTPTGGLIAVMGIVFLTALGKRILPDRVPAPEHLMARPSGTELEERYRLDERFWELQVQDCSSVSGKTLAQADLAGKFGVTVAAIWRGRKAIFNPEPSQLLMTGDMLLVVGRAERVHSLTDLGLIMGRDPLDRGVSRRGVHFVELMPAPHSAALGRTLKDLEFRRKFGLTAVALWRKDRAYRTDIGDFELTLGDSFLMIGPRSKIESLAKNPDFIVLESSSTDEPVQRRRAFIVGGLFAAGTITSIAGVPVYLVMLACAALTILFRVTSMEEAYRAIEWKAIFLIAGMYPASIALVHTGLAEMVGHWMVTRVSVLGPLGLASGAYILSAALTQIMGGQVTTLVSGPIIISSAIASHVNPQAMAVATAIGCSAAFVSPVAHPVNTMVMAPANYKFADFVRTGWLLMIVSFCGLLLGMTLFWRL